MRVSSTFDKVASLTCGDEASQSMSGVLRGPRVERLQIPDLLVDVHSLR